jgi:hypothetical protein
MPCSISRWMLRTHFPQLVPAPLTSPISLTVRAPASTASRIEPLVTASHRHTHTLLTVPAPAGSYTGDDRIGRTGPGLARGFGGSIWVADSPRALKRSGVRNAVTSATCAPAGVTTVKLGPHISRHQDSSQSHRRPAGPWPRLLRNGMAEAIGGRSRSSLSGAVRR